MDNDPDPMLPGPNPPTTLLTAESKTLLDNYYANLKLALDTGDTPTRLEFLNDVLTTAIENAGYGPWILLDEYDPGTNTTEGYAVLRVAPSYRDPEDKAYKEPYRIDHATLEKGFRAMRRRAGLNTPRNNTELNGWVADVLQADVLNDASIMDVVDALNIMEVALFGEVRYS